MVLGFQLLKQRPEISDGIGDGLRLVPVGEAARKRLLIALARRLLPILQTIPIQRVELPHDAVAQRLKILQRQPVRRLRRLGMSARDGSQQLRPQAPGHHLARVDVHVHDRHLVAIFIEALRGNDDLAEVLLVLDPIELDLEAGKLSLVNVAFRQKSIDGSDDVLCRGGGRLALEVIQLQDHDAAGM